MIDVTSIQSYTKCEIRAKALFGDDRDNGRKTDIQQGNLRFIKIELYCVEIFENIPFDVLQYALCISHINN